MNLINYFALILILALPINTFAGSSIVYDVLVQQDIEQEEELAAYYDLRNRKTYIQISNIEDENPLCIHVQIFQQDRGCSELDFEDELTPNDTVIYDMDDIKRNDGSDVPVDLLDDSYGYVVVSAYECSTGDDGANGVEDSLIGNFRIIDDSGYEYRTNMAGNGGFQDQITFLLEPVRNVIIPFNKVDGATHADIVGFVWQHDVNASGDDLGDETEDNVRNIPEGATFSVFQLDENEERLSCDTKNFACGPDKVMNYGVNDDFLPSRGDNVLCEGASLLPGQNHGYFVLENAQVTDGDNMDQDQLTFTCFIGLNNGNGTGSMDNCGYSCSNDPDGVDCFTE